MNKTRKIISIVLTILSLVFLVIVMLYASVWSVDKTHKVNMRISTVKLSVYHEDMGHYMSENIYGNNTELRILYFFKDFSEEEVKEVASASNGTVKTYIISSYDNYEENLNKVRNVSTIEKSNFVYAYDDQNASALSSFSSEIVYPYYLWSDKNAVLKYVSTTSIIEQKDNIAISELGNYEIGNQVGNYCYTRDITTLKQENGTLVDDYVFNLSKNKGKVTIINFWGYWCTPCKQELPYFNQIQEKYKDDVTVIAIHQGSTFKTGNKMETYNVSQTYDFINSNSNFSILWGYDDTDDSYYSMLGGSSTYPISIIVDQNGIVAFTRIGSLSYDELDTQVSKLLA